MIARTLALAAALLSASTAMAQVTVHVAPAGDDRNPGTQAKPVRSLERAQALVRAKNARDDVTVILADGSYKLTAPLIFRRADGGLNGRKVEWRAADGAKPIISSGIEVAGFTLHDEKERIYVAATPKGLDTRQIWVNGTVAERPWIELKSSDV
jgi:hypothetical protein